MHPVLGIHWIATTHGTWLHGDPQGSWLQGKLIGPDPFLETMVRENMTHDAVVLSDQECNLIERTIGVTCAEQGHVILAQTVQPTHVHVVLAPMAERIVNVVARLKRRASMEVLQLRRERGGIDVPRTLWTAKRFVVFITDDAHLQNTIAYVERHNCYAVR